MELYGCPADGCTSSVNLDRLEHSRSHVNQVLCFKAQKTHYMVSFALCMDSDLLLGRCSCTPTGVRSMCRACAVRLCFCFCTSQELLLLQSACMRTRAYNPPKLESQCRCCFHRNDSRVFIRCYHVSPAPHRPCCCVTTLSVCSGCHLQVEQGGTKRMEMLPSASCHAPQTLACCSIAPATSRIGKACLGVASIP